jgi:enoyl-CoA hydratase/carnithine racemase
LNNPEQYNAITEQLLADLGAAFEAALADDGARAIVLTGSGAQLGGDMFRAPAADVGKPVSAEGHQNRWASRRSQAAYSRAVGCGGLSRPAQPSALDGSAFKGL